VVQRRDAQNEGQKSPFSTLRHLDNVIMTGQAEANMLGFAAKEETKVYGRR
jgi:hypothetical protein